MILSQTKIYKRKKGTIFVEPGYINGYSDILRRQHFKHRQRSGDDDIYSLWRNLSDQSLGKPNQLDRLIQKREAGLNRGDGHLHLHSLCADNRYIDRQSTRL